MDIEDWNQFYEELMQDFHRAIAKGLIYDQKQDEAANYELNEQFSRMAVEQMAETMDPNLTHKKASVCAVCKHALVRRVGPFRLACEVPGCLDLTMPFDFTHFSVEDVMNRLQSSIYEH